MFGLFPMPFKTPKRNSSKGSSIDIMNRLGAGYRKIEIKFLETPRDFSLIYCPYTNSGVCLRCQSYRELNLNSQIYLLSTFSKCGATNSLLYVLPYSNVPLSRGKILPSSKTHQMFATHRYEMKLNAMSKQANEIKGLK